MINLEALAVDNAWAGLVVLFLGDPHGLEGGEGSKDGATDPYGVFTLRWSNDLDLDGGRSKSSNFLLHAVSNTGVHGGTTGEDVVSKKIFPDINITSHNRLIHCFMNAY